MKSKLHIFASIIVLAASALLIFKGNTIVGGIGLLLASIVYYGLKSDKKEGLATLDQYLEENPKLVNVQERLIFCKYCNSSKISVKETRENKEIHHCKDCEAELYYLNSYKD